jgi:hypothetical protein
MYCDVMPVFYDATERVARKQYKCCECSAPILMGEKHLVCCGKWENKISTYRQHLNCAAACMMIRDEFNDGECVGFGELKEWWAESCRFDRHHEEWKKFRGILSRILRRERACRMRGNNGKG